MRPRKKKGREIIANLPARGIKDYLSNDACTYVRSEIFEDFREKGGWCGINATRLRNSGIEGGANRRNLCTQKRSKGRERERESRRGKGKSLDG